MGKNDDTCKYIALGIALTIATIVFGLVYWLAKIILHDAPLAFLLALTLSCFSLEVVFNNVVRCSSNPFS